LWSVADIAEQGGPKRTRIFQAMRAGTLPSHKVGGRRYAKRTDAIAWLEGRKVAESPEIGETVAPTLEGHGFGKATGRSGRG
jgi:hypothetical protein